MEIIKLFSCFLVAISIDIEPFFSITNVLIMDQCLLYFMQISCKCNIDVSCWKIELYMSVDDAKIFFYDKWFFCAVCFGIYIKDIFQIIGVRGKWNNIVYAVGNKWCICICKMIDLIFLLSLFPSSKTLRSMIIHTNDK